MELQQQLVPGDVEVFHVENEIADHFKIEKVFALDSHYLKREDFILQKIMMAIARKTHIDDPTLFYSNSDEQYFKTRADLWAMFKNHRYSDGIDDRVFHEACDNTLKVAEKVEHIKIDSKPKMPAFGDSDEQLSVLVANRICELGLHLNNTVFEIDNRKVTYVEQAGIELNRIIEKGFSSYFMITQDLLNYGRSRGWPSSPRGSAPGSLINYLLGISNIDPVPWGLSFDRFLSESRGGFMLNVKMPSE